MTTHSFPPRRSSDLKGAGADDDLVRLRGRAASETGDVLEALRQADVLRALLDEEDLGGAFKVMVQVRERAGQ